MRRGAFVLLVCLAGCATHRAHSYSNASVVGKYRITSTVKPYVKFAGGPKIGSGELTFDGRGNLSGRETFESQQRTIRGTYEIEPDGTGTASLITALEDGSSSESALALQIQNDHQIKFVSEGLPQHSDWVSVQSLIAHGQAGLQGVLERE
jgi:hypothetical protein